MTIETLREKIQKAESNIQKQESKILFHKQRLLKATDEYDIAFIHDDIRNAERELVKKQNSLAKLKNKLSAAEAEEKFIQENTPKVLKMFLDNWVKKCLDYYLSTPAMYKAEKEKLYNASIAAQKEAIKTIPEYQSYFERMTSRYGEIDKWPDNLLLPFPQRPMMAYLHRMALDDISINKRLHERFDQTVFSLVLLKEEERLPWLERKLEEERKRKELDLLNKIYAITGPITDARQLGIDERGNLVGVIIGEKGSAKIATFGAGGYNVQCYHYRTVVTAI